MILFLAGCLTLDSFVYNNVPCTEVSEATCDEVGPEWDKICTVCEDPYAWDHAYTWEPGTLVEGESVDPIDPAIVVSQPVTTDDGEGTLDLYVLPSNGSDPALASTTILYQHGNYGGIEPYVARLQMLHDAGYGLIVWDYRGFGKSLPHAAPTPDQLMADARQVRALADTLAPDPSRIVLYGYSMGALPTVEMATTAPGCGLVLEAPFTSMSSIAEANSGASLGEQFLSEGQFDNVSKIAGYQGATLVMIGEEDHLFTVENATEVYDAAPGPKQLWTVPGANHGVGKGIPEQGLTTYLDTMKGFLADKAPGCLTQ